MKGKSVTTVKPPMFLFWAIVLSLFAMAIFMPHGVNDVLARQSQVIDSGFYTPTVTAGVNVASVSAPKPCLYQRIGDVVNVGCGLLIKPQTAAQTSTQVYVGTPFVSALQDGDAIGNGVSLKQYGPVTADPVNLTADLTFRAESTFTASWAVTFTYRIRP